MPGALDLRDSDSALRFSVEVADDAGERAEGLMFREAMPKFSGMLFVYESAQPVAFWMRNTLIPLDMLFFDGSGRLERIKVNATPHDETPVPGGNDIRYVLEINGGLARGARHRARRGDPPSRARPGDGGLDLRLSLCASAAARAALERGASGRGAAW